MPEESKFNIYLSSNPTCCSHGELLLFFNHSYVEGQPSYQQLTLTPQDFQAFAKWLYVKDGEYICPWFSAVFTKKDDDEQKIEVKVAPDLFPESVVEKGKKFSTSLTFKDSELHCLLMTTLHTAFMYALEQNGIKSDYCHLPSSQWVLDTLLGVTVDDESSFPQKKFEVYYPKDGYQYYDSGLDYPVKDNKYGAYASLIHLDYRTDEVFLHSYMPNAFVKGANLNEFNQFADEWNANNTIQIEKYPTFSCGCSMYHFISLSDFASQENIFDYLYQTLYEKPNKAISDCFNTLLKKHFFYTRQTLDEFNLVEKLMAIPNAFDYYEDRQDYIRVFIPCTPIDVPKKTHLLVQISQEKIYLANGRMNLGNATWREEYIPSENVFDQIMDGMAQHGYKIR